MTRFMAQFIAYFALQTKDFFQAAFTQLDAGFLRARASPFDQTPKAGAKPGRQGISSATSARQEADKVRAMADGVLRTDAHFAQELYAVAYGHELAALQHAAKPAGCF